MIKVSSFLVFYHFCWFWKLYALNHEHEKKKKKKYVHFSNLFINLLHDNAWLHVARMTMLGHMLPGWQCLATCCQDDNAWPHVTRMTMLGHMLPGWQCLATYCQDDNAWPHIARMTMLGHMLPGWQCLATCCQDDIVETHWLKIWDFATSTISSWSLTHQLQF